MAHPIKHYLPFDVAVCMDFAIDVNDIISMITSIVCGGIIGFERELKNKSTGLRTIVLISLGSTIFSIVSRHGAGTDDRISANIITGIGFIGAGVIFKDKMSVLGLTTAAVIWTAAAIGMTAGVGYHGLAIVFTLITLGILLLVNKIELVIDSLPKNKIFNIAFVGQDIQQLEMLEDHIKKQQLKSKRVEVYKDEQALNVVLLISGKKVNVTQISELMIQMEAVKSFH
jgi:putative Mg2+ transporter-C (MgtC) family protein